MASFAQPPQTIANINIAQRRLKSLPYKSSRALYRFTFPPICLKLQPIFCTKLSSWEPSPSITYVHNEETDDNFLKSGSNIFETMTAESTTETSIPNDTSETSALNDRDGVLDASNQLSMHSQLLKWLMWLLGPSVLLATGMVPTLWLPLSSVYLGTNVASLLSLVGLDCIFNIGVTLFLLMADACARPKSPTQSCKSQAPFSYRFWNMAASIIGFVIPLAMFMASHKGFLQPQLSFISFSVLLVPYLLLLSIQMLTEMLTWHWESPVWLVTPVVYEAYRVLQLMRGLKLGAEIVAPAWMVHTIRGLVSWWVLILGMQLMRVAWFAGFTARTQKQA
ncbi:PREDICTED: uncharacterized protein LOC104598531 [Nelumbo nucifera]|uniref:Uncharacterized protein LOC104598531 n=1 Tax=Nelumbo nucifera TaxID=4432 RepID=A0A1U8AA84_NELNU|nr:PREDICTED: uncharacterized protein LOC104598531 [Nelumbo nucifera]